MQRYPHVTIRFSIIIAFFRPKYSQVRPPPNDPMKDPITNKLAVNQNVYQIIRIIDPFIVVDSEKVIISSKISKTTTEP